MLRRTYDGQSCSLARSLEVVGERWTLLIIRDALIGIRRFEEFHERLGIARNVLSLRLHRLVENDVLTRYRYQERPDRFEYHLTERGRDLGTTVLALMEWGDRHLSGELGPPQLTEHARCGTSVQAQLICPGCARQIQPTEIVTRPNPAVAAQLCDVAPEATREVLVG